jgi:hypothetical protein
MARPRSQPTFSHSRLYVAFYDDHGFFTFISHIVLVLLCLSSIGLTLKYTSISPSAPSRLAASSWSSVLMSSPRLLRTSVACALERRDLVSPDHRKSIRAPIELVSVEAMQSIFTNIHLSMQINTVSTVSSPDSCAKEETSPTTMVSGRKRTDFE